MADIFSLAPIQGITDYVFRKLICKHFIGIDKVYTPFLRLQNDKTLKKSQIHDVLPENNEGINVIPQILCNTAEDFLFLVEYLLNLGYEEVNWNLGCPYPMVTKRKMGASLLPFPEKVYDILEMAIPKTRCKISVKVRSGYESEEDIMRLLPVLNQFPITEVIIHPRIAKQMYKGRANADVAERCLKIYSGNLAYNGDIQDIASFQILRNKLNGVSHWMIGRALIANPFLTQELISGEEICSEEKMSRFTEFYDDLFDTYQSNLFGPGHLLNRMHQFWEYFSTSFSNSHKVWKQIKKAKSIEKYTQAVNAVFRNEFFYK